MHESAQRIRALFRARLRSGTASGAPIAHVLTHGALSALVAGLVSGVLPPFAYALVVLSLSGALLALPFLGELGALLRADPVDEWVASLPAHRIERRLARSLAALAAVLTLAASSLLPAVLFAPDTLDPLARAGLLAAGLGQALLLAASLLAAQNLLGERAEPLLVLLQGALVVAIAVFLMTGLEYLPELRAIARPGDGPASLAWLPPAWFAAPFAPGAGALQRLLPLALAAAALAALTAAPLPEQARVSARAGLLDHLLAPLRRLATRTWLAPGERAAFDLVWDGLPREREFRLRSYPLLGLPIAFLWIAASGEPGEEREGLLALLLFSPGMYLPALLAQVPCSASHEASWMLATAPIARAKLDGGAQKAVAVRLLLPAQLLLVLLAWQQVDLAFALRLGIPAGLAAVLAMRMQWAKLVRDLPLSVPPERMGAGSDLSGPMLGAAVGLAILAIFAWRFAGDLASTALVSGLLVAAVVFSGRRAAAAA